MLLDVRNVSKTYGRDHSFVALDDVSLHVESGECVGIIGPSGSGKSTLARIIAGLEVADCGSVSFDGVTRGNNAAAPCEQPAHQHSKHPTHKQRARIQAAWLNMQMIFQNPEMSFPSSQCMGKAIAEGLVYQQKLTKQQKTQLVSEALEAVGLPASFANKRAFEMSGGQCQRAAIARAIIGNPTLILCDEPTSALDVTVQANIMQLLSRLHEQRGISLLFISHNVALVNNLCTRIYCLEAGRITDQLVAR